MVGKKDTCRQNDCPWSALEDASGEHTGANQIIGWRTTIDDGQQPLRHGTLTLETIEINHEHSRRLPRQAPLCDQDVCADQPHLQTRQVFKG